MHYLGMNNLGFQLKSLGSAIGSIIAFSANSAVAQIIPDGTLPTNSKVTTNNQITTITGGTRAGSNLFHSFDKFSLTNEAIAEFKDIAGVENIISRITGKSISDINGTLKASGTANLFLINPNGILFGPNAALDIGGSFLATTASSINFADGKFSATEPQVAPLLSVNIPIGLQFVGTAAPIRNQSQASPNGASNIYNQPVGLQVQPSKTLALVGGNLKLEGGSLTAKSGRIELGSVASNSLVSLRLTSLDWMLGYERVQNFENIQLIERTFGDSEIPSTVDTSGEGGGSIQVRGKTVELIGDLVTLSSRTTGVVNGRDLTINAEKLIVGDGAQVDTSTSGKGNAGNLFVNTSDSVELIGSVTVPNTNFDQVSLLVSATTGEGKAGNIEINTQRLRILDGAQISTQSSGFSIPPQNIQFQPATGDGGNLTIKASSSVELIGTSPNGFGSNLSSSTLGSGKAGQVTVTTLKLAIRDGAAINVRSRVPRFGVYLGDASNLGPAGDINLNARYILLDNKGQLTSNSQVGKGGNIRLQVQDVLLLRRNSQISTNAGTANAPGNAGNITINALNGFLVAAPLENSDITANAFSGSGGKVIINAKSIFEFVPRTRADLVRLLNTEDPGQLNSSNLQTNDITAFSQQSPSLNGTVQINSPDVDPSKGLLEQPVNVVDASRQITPSCNRSGKLARSSFTVTERGGIASSPTEPLTADAVLADWITPQPEGKNRVDGIQDRVAIPAPRNTENTPGRVKSVNQSPQLVEANRWIIDAKGNVVLVAQASNARLHSPALSPVACVAN